MSPPNGDWRDGGRIATLDNWLAMGQNYIYIYMMMICAYIYFCSWYMLTLSIYIYMFFCQLPSVMIFHLKANKYKLVVSFGLLYIRRRARCLCNACGIRPASNEKPGAHLEWSHPALEQVRSYVRTQSLEKGYHPRLVANFDQVWSTIFRPSRSCLQKKGTRSQDPLQRSAYLRRVRHQVERAS